MKTLGMYFGPKVICMVETQGGRVTNNISVSRAALSLGEMEAKVPEEVKIVALFKDELRRKRIETPEVNICLSGKDLIIRTFELPSLPHKELKNAINFEAKKYIPFKLEELFSASQLVFDKVAKKNIVLFVGIRKDTMERYLSILNQLNLKSVLVEYSGFSILRLLKLSHYNYKGIAAVCTADVQEGDEVNFTVLEEAFPLFSRDIMLFTGPEGQNKDTTAVFEKLKTEIRVSLDYFHRNFPNKNLNKIFFIMSKDYRQNLEGFIKELGLVPDFIDLEAYIGKSVIFSSSFIKGYSASLSQAIIMPIKADLMEAREEVLRDLAAQTGFSLAALTKDLKIKPQTVILGLLICSLTFALGIYQRMPVEKELEAIIGMRPKVASVSTEANYDQLVSLDSQYKAKLKVLNEVSRKNFYFTELLNAIPRVIPEGIWLSDFYFDRKEEKAAGKKEERMEIIFEGLAYSSDANKEFDLVNNFVAKLKGDDVFARYFNQASIASLDRKPFGSTTVTVFKVQCRKQ